MKKEYIFTLTCVLLSLIGLWVLLKSPVLGNNAVNQFLRVAMGGAGDTATINIMLEQYTSSYRLTGVVLLSSGLFGTIISLYKTTFKQCDEIR